MMRIRKQLTGLVLAILLGLGNFASIIHAEDTGEYGTEGSEETVEEIIEETPENETEETGGFDDVQAIAVQEQTVLQGEIPLNDVGQETKLWSASAYYAAEDSAYDTHKTDDFNLMYQVEFHSNTNIPAGAITIKIPSLLLTTRDGVQKKADDIAIPKAIEQYDEDGNFIGYQPQETKNIAFNYYEITEDGVDYYVYYNYREMMIGTSAAFQVLYKNLKVMDIKDETAWDLPVDIKVDYTYTDEEGQEHHVAQSEDNPDLTGDIDSKVEFKSVTKIGYKEPSKSYTPALYTKRQVDQYATAYKDPDNYAATAGSDDFSAYKYAVYEVNVKVTNATQGYYVELEEQLPAGAKVIGFGNKQPGQSIAVNKVSETTEGDITRAVYRIYDNSSWCDYGFEDVSDPVTAYQKERNITYGRVLVVVAYPSESFATMFPEKQGVLRIVYNTINCRIIPIDGDDEIQSGSSETSFPYREYEYGYEGDGISSSKADARSVNGSYNGWTNVWKGSTEKGEHGGLNFTYSASARYYGETHYLTGSQVGEPIPGKYLRLTTVDDQLYVSTGGGMDLTKEGTDGTFMPLTYKDYYYTAVKITTSDVSYDVMEDTTIPVEEDTLYKNLGTWVYAMYGDNPEQWEEAAYITGKQYTFTAEQIARHPYRVMAVHESNAYALGTTIDVTVSLLRDSQTLQDYIIPAATASRTDNTVNSITLENNAGIAVQKVTVEHNDETGEDEKIVAPELLNVNADKDSGTAPRYKTPVDKDNNAYVVNDTARLYTQEANSPIGTTQPLRYRNWYGKESPNTQGYAYLNAVNPIAKTYKTGTATNDAINARVKIRYNMIEYSGYEIYDKIVMNYMTKEDEGYTGHNDVVFYDLLPLGIEFDPSEEIIAGRLTTGSEKEVFNYTNAWDTRNITVTVNDEDVISNYNGTGQTLVVFHVHYEGLDPTVYTESRDLDNWIRRLWMEGWGVSFGAYYKWENAELVEGNDAYNIFAFTTEENDEDKKDIVGKTLLGSVSSRTPETAVLQIQPAGTCDENDPEIRACNVNQAGDVIRSTVEPGIYKQLTSARSPLFQNNETNPEEIVFGKGKVEDLFAKSAQTEIIKKVKANVDRFGTYTDEALVEGGKEYTYELTVKNVGDETTGLIVYDHLENTINEVVEIKADGTPVTYLDIASTKASELNKKFDSKSWIGELIDINTRGLVIEGVAPVIYYSTKINAEQPLKADLLANSEDWTKKDEYTGSLSDVRSIAVDMTKATDGSSFVLGNMESVTFYVTMKAPNYDAVPTDITYAYNDASYVKGVMGTATTDLYSNSVRVKVVPTKYDTRIVEKQIEDLEKVPESARDYAFTFTAERLTDIREADGMVISDYVRMANQEYYLLEKDESGEWQKVGSTLISTDENGQFTLKNGQRAEFTVNHEEQIRFTEEENAFWSVEEEKTVENVTSLAGEVQQYTHLFKNTYRPVLYVSKVAENYGDKNVTRETFKFKLSIKTAGEEEWHDGAGVGYWKVDRAYSDETVPSKKKNTTSYVTADDGTFEIRANETVALFPGEIGTEYRVEEVETGEDWILVDAAPAEGTMRATGNLVSITNQYRYRELYVTKEVTHQDKEGYCDKVFTFVVRKINGTESTPVTGNRYYILDENKEIQKEGEELKPDTYGEIDSEGKFTIHGGETIMIEKLEQNQYYEVSEVTAEDGTALVGGEKSEYRPVSASVEVKMPVYSMSKAVTISNDYLLRPLSITKLVVTQDGNVNNDRDFVMTLYADMDGSGVMEACRNQKYTIAGVEKETNDRGEFTIRNGQTATFEYLARQGTAYKIVETEDTEYQQIYPADKKAAEGMIEAEGSSVMFVNGEEGILLIGKEYTTSEEAQSGEEDTRTAGRKYYDALYENSKTRPVTVTLEVNDGSETYNWPKAVEEGVTEVTVNIIDTRTASTGTMTVPVGGPIELSPWVKLIIPLDPDKNYSYKLTETKMDANQIYTNEELGYEGIGFVQVAANENPLTGSVKDKPVAVIENQISSLTPISTVMKRMHLNSEEVETGAELVLIVEKYTGSSWEPASGIEYVVSEYSAEENDTYFNHTEEAADVSTVSTSVSTTNNDGKIRYRKSSENVLPRINFLKDKVYVEKETWTEGDLRITEVSAECDESWGSWTKNIQKENAGIIENSNRTKQIEVHKELLEGEEDDGRSYTFTLKQVLSAKKADNGSIKSVLKDQAGANIGYDVYDANGEYVEHRTTDGEGSITIPAGYTARLSIQEDTFWTVTEVQDSVYRLIDDGMKLENTEETQTGKLSNIQAVIGASVEKVPVFISAEPDFDVTEPMTEVQLRNAAYIVTLTYSDGSTQILSKDADTNGYTMEQVGDVSDGKLNLLFKYKQDENLQTILSMSVTNTNYQDYFYTGGVQTFTAPVSGYYKLEVWGAQGGSGLKGYATGGAVDWDTDLANNTENPGGKGGYSYGEVWLNKDQTIYISVGGQGKTLEYNYVKHGADIENWHNAVEYATGNNQTISGGWNGGGMSSSNDGADGAASVNGTGGGATSIQLTMVGDGQLKNYVNNKDDVLLVAGGGGGSHYYNNYKQKYHHYGTGGSGGGTSGQINYEVYSIRGGSDSTSNPDNYSTAPGQSGIDSRFGEGSYSDGGGWYTATHASHADGGTGGSGHVNESSVKNGATIGGGTWAGYVDDGDRSTDGNEGEGHARVTYIPQTVFNYEYTGTEQVFEAPEDGLYKLEAWGAQGGDITGGAGSADTGTYYGGKGAYTSGTVYLSKGTKLYVYVGGSGNNDGKYTGIMTGKELTGHGHYGGYNGGGRVSAADEGNRDDQAKYGAPGGGATDFRTIPASNLGSTYENNMDTQMANMNSYKSRIMVAAGGGGANNRSGNGTVDYGAGNGGAGGTLTGISGELKPGTVPGTKYGGYDRNYGLGGTQQAGGKTFNNTTQAVVSGNVLTVADARFFYGGQSQSGGGGGYYGGAGASHGGGGGGSSYINGYTGCDTTNKNNSYLFNNGIMIAGNQSMTSPEKTSETGHSGNGYARISKVEADVEFVDYVEAKQTAAIYTGLTLASDDYEIKAKFMPNEKVNAASGNLSSTVFGSYAANTTLYRINAYKNTVRAHCYSTSSSSVDIKKTEWENSIGHTFTVDLDKNGVSVAYEDGTTAYFPTTRTTATGSGSHGLYLFAEGTGGNAAYYGRIYYLQVIKAGTVIMDLRPAKKDGIFGMYDMRTGTFYKSTVNALSGPNGS